ncbi:hypothetical protein GCM10009853_072650 [Glycomyces scopariae]
MDGVAVGCWERGVDIVRDGDDELLFDPLGETGASRRCVGLVDGEGGAWWNLDGTDAWVRATDPNAIALYEATQERAAEIIAQIQRKLQR